MSTRFFRAALTTGMTGSSIDHELAASLAARDRDANSSTRATTRRTTTGFSTLLLERSPDREPQPHRPAHSAWRCLHRALTRLSAN